HGKPPGGGALATVTVAAFDVDVAFRLSVAFAVIEYVPAATFVHVALYGLLVTVPIDAAPLKNSTFETVPSLSDAVALSEIVAGSLYVAPFTGDVNVTVGRA